MRHGYVNAHVGALKLFAQITLSTVIQSVAVATKTNQERMAIILFTEESTQGYLIFGAACAKDV
jgi:hypothetical protein